MLARRAMMAAAGQGELDFALLAPDATVIGAWRGDSLVDGGAGVASSWTDRVGSFDLTANNSPTIASNNAGLNNQPVARFVAASSQSFTRDTTPSQSQPLTWIVIGEAGGASQQFVDGRSSTTRATIQISAAPKVAMFGGAVLEGTSAGTNVPILIEGYFNGASSSLRGNSVVEASGDAGTQTLTGISVGARWDGAQFLNGDIAEIILVSGELTEADRVYLALYAAQRYGFAVPFPQVLSVTESSFATGGATNNVDMPSTVKAGELLLILASNDDTSSLLGTPTGWTSLWANLPYRLAGFYKVADGTEGGTSVSLDTLGGVRIAAQCYRLSLWGQNTAAINVGAAVADGTSSAPNPPSVDGFGSRGTLYIAACGCEDDGSAVTAAPTGYTNLVATEAGATANQQTSLGTARRELNASSENPGAFTVAASQAWSAQSIAIKGLG